MNTRPNATPIRRPFSTDMFSLQKPKSHSPDCRSAYLAIFILCTSVAFSGRSGASTQIVFSSGADPTLSHYLSDGATEIPTGGEFFFELGTFADGFVPTSENTDQWLDNWVMVNDPSGDPDPGARADYELRSSLFGPYGGFSSSVDLAQTWRSFWPIHDFHAAASETRADPAAVGFMEPFQRTGPVS